MQVSGVAVRRHAVLEGRLLWLLADADATVVAAMLMLSFSLPC